MRISDWSSDVCSSDLLCARPSVGRCPRRKARRDESSRALFAYRRFLRLRSFVWMPRPYSACAAVSATRPPEPTGRPENVRSEEHTSELQSLMRISYAVFCLKKKHITDKKNTIK